MNRAQRWILLVAMGMFSASSLAAQEGASEPTSGDNLTSEDVQRHVDEIGDKVEEIARD
jgi:hypothetical protein